MENTVKKTAI